MRNPSELYSLTSDAEVTPTATGPLIVALGGFVDAGHTQELLTKHLLSTSPHRLIGSFDADQLVDYRGRRPPMVFEHNRYTSYDEPKIELYQLTDQADHPYYLLAGAEPDYQWERMADAVHELTEKLNVDLVVTAHGIPMGVPHTRPIGMTRHASDPKLIDNVRSPFGMVQVPASFSALLELRLGERGVDAVGYAVHVPAYLAQSEYPQASLAALRAIGDSTGLSIPDDELEGAISIISAKIASEVADNDEVRGVVAAMEQQYDEYMAAQQPRSLQPAEHELPSADELGAEVEAFLKQVNESDDEQ